MRHDDQPVPNIQMKKLYLSLRKDPKGSDLLRSFSVEKGRAELDPCVINSKVSVHLM